MSRLRFGYVTGPVLGALWLFVLATTLAVLMSFATGDPFRPAGLWSLLWGAALGLGLVALHLGKWTVSLATAAAFVLLAVIGIGPVAGQQTAQDRRHLHKVGPGAYDVENLQHLFSVKAKTLGWDFMDSSFSPCFSPNP